METPYKPPYEVSDTAINLIAGIVDLLTRLELGVDSGVLMHLRKDHQLRSIQSSLAIENNSLSLEQVTDVVNGRRVRGDPREILEVKNAFAAYSALESFKPFRISDFLKAHAVMMDGLVAMSGHFRMSSVGVFAGTQLIHAAPPPEFVQGHLKNLFEWARRSKAHPLIKSSVMHYEIEFIHPFLDGNGRMGRFWQSVVLANWNPTFSWLPVETIVYQKQSTYYAALRQADTEGSATVFVEFMLQSILEAVQKQNTSNNGAVNGAINGVVTVVHNYVRAHGGCRANAVAEALGIPFRSVQRHLSSLRKAGRIEFRGAPKNGGYWRVE